MSDKTDPKNKTTGKVYTMDLRWENRTGVRPGTRVPGWKCPGTLAQTWHQAQMIQIYSNPLKFFVSPCPEYQQRIGWYFVYATRALA